MRVLIVEDNEVQSRFAQISLERRGLDVDCVGTLKDAVKRLSEPGIDAILLDLSLPDSAGIESFYTIRSLASELPVVIFTGTDDQDVALLALKHGAQDFLIKGQARDDTVVRCLRYAIERSNADAALRTSEKRLRVILENSHDAFISMDSAWHIKDWNGQAERIFGKPREEMLGQPLSAIAPHHLRKRYARQVANFFSRNQDKIARMTDEMVGIHQDGHEFPMEIVIFRIQEDIDYLYCAFVRDITSRKQIEAELERRVQERTAELTESNEELKQFAKIASHDLQEPLRAIQGFAKLLVENAAGKLDSDGQEFLEYIIDGTNRMQALIQSVLLHSSIKRETPEDVSTDCNSVIEEVLANLDASLKENDVQLEVDSLPEVAVERWQLIQLFQNLISNAIKYRSKDRPSIFISAEPSVDEWLFSVRDNGIGIDPKYVDKIFDMFARLHGKTEYSGTGMGLAICKRIVTMHGGNIWVESELGRGCIFLFTLPGVSKLPRRAAMDKDTIEILLVEDTPSDVRLTQEALKRSDLKYTLNVVTDGVEAMEYLNKRKNSKTENLPDIILLDLNMPKKNGHEVLAEIKQDPHLKNIAIVVLTVSQRNEDVMEALKLRMNYYLAKPVTSQTLSALVKQIIELQSQPAEGQHHNQEETHIRLVLAGNPHTPATILAKLAADENVRVRARVAENPETPADVLVRLAGDSDPEVRLSVSENLKVSEGLLETLAKDPSEDVRLGIAGNPKIPVHILSLLKGDENMFVASAASDSLSKASNR